MTLKRMFYIFLPTFSVDFASTLCFSNRIEFGKQDDPETVVALRVRCPGSRTHTELVESPAQYSLDNVWDDARINRSFKVDPYNWTNTICEY